MFKKAILVFIFIVSGTSFLYASTFYVAPAGNDNNSGNLNSPFATIQKAQQAVQPGDTVYIRAGSYALKETQIARKEKIWAYVTYLDKSGLPGKPIHYWAYPGEKPVFDLSLIKPAGLRVIAFFVSGSWLHFKGFEITGVQVTIKTHTQSECFENLGSNNVFELLNMHDGMAIGFYLLSGSNNLVLNCDAYCNHDNFSENGKGGNTDGFGCHPSKGSTGNVFRGCRAWFNSDDGYDVINAHESVTFENCWAFYNGFSTDFKSQGDGNGFKGGGYGNRRADQLPDPIPRHIIRFCISVRNKANGFYSNHHPGGSDWFNNKAFRNNINYNMLNRLKDNVTDVPGYGHSLINNISYKGRADIQNIDTTSCRLLNNIFDQKTSLMDYDFVSMDEALLLSPRDKDGSLPQNGFMKLKNLIYSEDFVLPLDRRQWIVEMEPSEGSSVYTKDKALILDTRKGVTVWLNKKMNADLLIEFDREVMVDNGKNDRLSDMNVFWMATDKSKSTPFGRKGVFEQYDSLSLYYAGIGGNTNKTTRFRKYQGDGKKEILSEYSDAMHLLVKNKQYHCSILVSGGSTSLRINNDLYFEFTDPKFLHEGYFGFRSTWSRQAIKNFRVYQLL